MTFTFRPAARSNAKPLIGLYSESGCGKTRSGLLLTCGFVGGDMSKVGMIETESGRGEAYAGDPIIGGYRVLSLRDDFSPANYGKAIKAAEGDGLQALILDSASHEWEGSHGVLSMAADAQAAGKKGPLVWQAPKMAHQREFMLRLMQTPIPLVVVCMRAKYPMKEQKNARGEKEWTRSTVLEPKQSDDILFEMFVHGWIDQEHRFHGTKYTLDELRQCMKDNEPITEESGKRLAAWAAGSTPPKTAARTDPLEASSSGPKGNASNPSDAAAYLTPDQQLEIADECRKLGPNTLPALLAAASRKLGREVASIAMMPADWHQNCKDFIAAAIEKRKAKETA